MSRRRYRSAAQPRSRASPQVLMSGYGDAGASYKRRALKGFIAHSSSPKEDIDFNNQTLRQRSRMLAMSTPIAKSAINTSRTNVIGPGLKLKSAINHDILGLTAEQAVAWQRHTEAEFELWASDKSACDATRMNDFYALQQLAYSSWLTSGDVFAVFKRCKRTSFYPYSLRLHIVEADRVRTPGMAGWGTYGRAENGNRIFDGVEVNEDGAVTAYYVSNQHPYEVGDGAEKTVRIEAYGVKTGLPNIIQVMESERPDQYRGVSFLAPVIEPLLQLRRYTDTELTAANIEASFAAFVKTTASTDAMPFSEVGNGSLYGTPINEPQVSTSENEYELAPGAINIMEPGEDVVFADPKRPAGGFSAFVSAVSAQVGAALEIPVDLLLKVFTSSYSAARAVLMEAWKSFKMRRQWFINDFCKPTYKVWLSEAIALGRISAPGFFTDPLIRNAYLGSEWVGPAQGMLDPTKEIKAEVEAIIHGFSTHEASAVRINGSQWQDNIKQLQVEYMQMRKAGIPVYSDATGAIQEEEEDSVDDKGK